LTDLKFMVKKSKRSQTLYTHHIQKCNI